MYNCHAEIYHRDGIVRKCAYINDSSLELAKRYCMREAQREFDQLMKCYQNQEFFQPTRIENVVEEW